MKLEDLPGLSGYAKPYVYSGDPYRTRCDALEARLKLACELLKVASDQADYGWKVVDAFLDKMKSEGLIP